MRGLLAAVVVMGVLILVATAGLIALVIHRATVHRAALAPQERLALSVVLNEPPGTRIAGSEAADNRLVLQLSGGGPDRVIVVNLRNGAVLLRVQLTR